jgi:hypothetical protein
MPLPDGRRADVMAITQQCEVVIIEAKSGARDFLTDQKWPSYRAWCDRLFFAVDLDFPQELLPDDVGLLVADGRETSLLRDAPSHPMAPARRKSLLLRFAMLAGRRLAAEQDPWGAEELRLALRFE